MRFLRTGKRCATCRHTAIEDEAYTWDNNELTLSESTSAVSSLSEEIPDTAKSNNEQQKGERITTPRMVETRILAAMTNLRSTIQQIEAARLASPKQQEQQHQLLVAACTLESAIDNVDDALVASKCLQLDNNDDVSDLDNEEEEYNTLLCCLNEYEDELDAMTVSTEDTTDVRERESIRVLEELQAEEKILRKMMKMAVAIREKHEEEEGIEISIAF
jgi:hypothetical protein